MGIKLKILMTSLCKIVFLSIIITSSIFAQTGLFQKISRMIDSVSTNNLVEHIKYLESPGGHNSRVTFTPGNDSAAVYIEREFKKNVSLTSVTLDTFYISTASSPFNTKPLVNIVATLEGKVNPNKVIIAGAHYDCSASYESNWNSQWQTIRAPGADDNATGVAALLEIARILCDTTFGFENDYTIILVAFAAEERTPADNNSPSHYGSIHYANNLSISTDNFIGMLNLDMLGYNPNYNFQLIVTNSNSQSFTDQYISVNSIFNLNLILEKLVNSSWTYSDHKSFWDKGYKALCAIEYTPWNNHPSGYYSANPVYHTSSDTFGTLNMGLVTKMTKLTLGGLCCFAGPLTNTEEFKNEQPKEFYLSQNFPNPFNPTTKIKYSLPSITTSNELSSQQMVRLKIYNILGEEMATLVNEEKSPGIYEVEFDGTGFTTGIYLYRLEVGNYSEAKKMLLLK